MALATEQVMHRQPLADVGNDDTMTAARLAVSHLVNRPGISYGKLDSACKQQATRNDPSIVADCHAIARLAQQQGPAAQSGVL